jgi:hypothetical protein
MVLVIAECFRHGSKNTVCQTKISLLLKIKQKQHYFSFLNNDCYNVHNNTGKSHAQREGKFYHNCREMCKVSEKNLTNNPLLIIWSHCLTVRIRDFDKLNLNDGLILQFVTFSSKKSNRFHGFRSKLRDYYF